MSAINNISQDFFGTVNNLGTNPFVLVVLIVIILIYYILFAFLGKVTGGGDDSSSKSAGSIFIEAILWGLFIILIFFNGISYFFGVNLITEITNLTSKKPEIKIKQNYDPSNNKQVPSISPQAAKDGKSEVFHVPGERFTYHDAKAVCKAFDSDMATFEQINSAQKSGATWCSYGWSNDQLGIYPTSQNMWDKLQKNDEHKHDCGLPGVNGGYVADPYIKMGANCYGVKPKQSDLEKQMSDVTDDGVPMTAKEVLFNKRVHYWKNRVGNILISPFNNTSWFKS